MVHALDILASGLVALQVADGLDFASGHFHEHTGSPLGSGLETHVIEFVLDNVL